MEHVDVIKSQATLEHPFCICKVTVRSYLVTVVCWPTPAEQGERTHMFLYVWEGLVFSRRVQAIGATQYPAV